MTTEPTTDSDVNLFLSTFTTNHERSHYWAHHAHPAAGESGVPDPYRRIGIIGGGTAGFLTALALRAKLPRLEVTLVESSTIPIIGVGEATVPHIIPFLHRFCQLDIHDFYQKVRPTWKQGIKFEWGPPDIPHFHAPFDWEENNVGALGSLRYAGNLNSMTFESLLMEHHVTPIISRDGAYRSLLPYIQFAYHLENKRLVMYLHEVAVARGVKHLDRKIADVILTSDGLEVDHLVTDQGEKLSFDLYIDCTGFRSLLLGQKLQTPFVSYASTLYTDRALTFSVPHDGHIKPYTTASTMTSGWTWTIPHDDRDNHGYVFSSAFCTPEEAEREARVRWPRMSEVSDVVRFRSGRHEESWKGNVLAIGNASAFVEPLESTGLLMICWTIQKFIALFPCSKRDQAARLLLNPYIARRWDELRWFLSIHYKFNRKLQTPFWQEVRAKADISGAEPLLRAFEELAPLSSHGNEVHKILDECCPTIFYELQGWDCLLLGQGVPARFFELTEEREAWERRKRTAMELVGKAVDHTQALTLVRERPEFLDQLLNSADGWVHRSYPAAAK